MLPSTLQKGSPPPILAQSVGAALGIADAIAGIVETSDATQIKEVDNCLVVGVVVAQAPESDPPEPFPGVLPPQDVVQLG